MQLFDSTPFIWGNVTCLCDTTIKSCPFGNLNLISTYSPLSNCDGNTIMLYSCCLTSAASCSSSYIKSDVTTVPGCRSTFAFKPLGRRFPVASIASFPSLSFAFELYMIDDV